MVPSCGHCGKRFGGCCCTFRTARSFESLLNLRTPQEFFPELFLGQAYTFVSTSLSAVSGLPYATFEVCSTPFLHTTHSYAALSPSPNTPQSAPSRLKTK